MTWHVTFVDRELHVFVGGGSRLLERVQKERWPGAHTHAERTWRGSEAQGTNQQQRGEWREGSLLLAPIASARPACNGEIEREEREKREGRRRQE